MHEQHPMVLEQDAQLAANPPESAGLDLDHTRLCVDQIRDKSLKRHLLARARGRVPILQRPMQGAFVQAADAHRVYAILALARSMTRGIARARAGRLRTGSADRYPQPLEKTYGDA
ncbi:MAG: hypothetical protein RL756_1941 [Pseudomonadota bacterium]